jgi:hypothetical protein
MPKLWVGLIRIGDAEQGKIVLAIDGPNAQLNRTRDWIRRSSRQSTGLVSSRRATGLPR